MAASAEAPSAPMPLLYRLRARGRMGTRTLRGGGALEVGDLRLVEDGSNRSGSFSSDVVAFETASEGQDGNGERVGVSMGRRVALHALRESSSPFRAKTVVLETVNGRRSRNGEECQWGADTKTNTRGGGALELDEHGVRLDAARDEAGGEGAELLVREIDPLGEHQLGRRQPQALDGLAAPAHVHERPQAGRALELDQQPEELEHLRSVAHDAVDDVARQARARRQQRLVHQLHLADVLGAVDHHIEVDHHVPPAAARR
eukprot:scaffold37942_cov57-Phaeocystis_antarctica.AAC.5